jgi:hypothetical protein
VARFALGLAAILLTGTMAVQASITGSISGVVTDPCFLLMRCEGEEDF